MPAPVSAAALKPVVATTAGAALLNNMGMVFPSPHNYELRYWLAAGGLHPGFYAPGSATTRASARRAMLLSDSAPDARHPGGGDHRRLVGSPGTSRRSPGQ